MEKITNLEHTTHANAGIAREWAVCRYFGINRQAHDSGAYDRDSDVNFGDLHISVKASAFTLMSGSLCEGLTNFDDIWNLYAMRVHSNRVIYMTADYTAYMMTIDEFKMFVYMFCHTERESQKNGGTVKIRCAKETAKMLRWLEGRVA